MSSQSTSPAWWSERLQALVEALTAARTQAEVVAAVLPPALQAVGGAAGVVLLVDETGARLDPVARQGHAAGARPVWPDGGPLDGHLPAKDALERHEALYFEQPGDLSRAYPGLAAHAGAAAAVVPVVLDGPPLGAVLLGVPAPHTFTPEARHFLQTLAAQLALALDRARQTRQLQAWEEELAARALALDRFAELARSQAPAPAALIRQAQQAVTELIGGGFAVYFELEGAAWRLRSQVGSPEDEAIQALLESALPYETVLNDRISWESGGPLDQDADDPALDHGVPGPGVPGTGALVSTATLPLWVGGRRRGMFGYGLKAPRVWTRADRATLETAVFSLGLALERAERTRALDEERAALDAFVAFAEAAGTGSDVLALAAQALAVLSARFPDCSCGYTELEQGLWKLRVHSPDLHDLPELLQQSLAGLPRDTPIFARTLELGAPVFVDAWDAAQGQIERTEVYGTLATYPLIDQGELRGVLTIGLRRQTRWTERDKVVVRAVGRSLNLALERTQQARRLQARTDEEQRRAQALAAFAELARDLVLETDSLVLIRRAQEIVLGLLPAGFSVYFEPREGLWRIGSQVGHANTPELQAVLDSGLPFEAAANLLTPWRSGQPHYQDEYNPDLDQLTGSDEYPGASVTIPIPVGGQTRGVLGFALHQVRSWSGEDRAVLETVGRQLTLALERAERTRTLDEERAALDAFARFTEGSTHTTDALTLAKGARDVLRATLGVEVGYSELDGGLWKGRVFSDTTPPEVMAQSQQGFPADLPAFARPFEAGEVVFVDGWDPEGAAHTEVYGAAALYPYFEGGQPHGLLTMGTPDARAWTERERSVFRSVGRSLALAFERAEGARQLQLQNAELDARTRALEAFGELTRDLSVQHAPEVLIERALAMTLSLLPGGYAAFWRVQGGRWQAGPLVGHGGPPETQAAIQAGAPAGEVPTLDLPLQSRAPLFQDVYDRTRNGVPDLVQHIHTIAALPVFVNEQVAGIFNVVLFGPHSWSPADRAVLETISRSLGLALERAGAARDLMTAQARLRAVVDNAPVVLFALNRSGTFTLSEGRGLAGLGLQPGQAVGQSAFELYRDAPELLDDLQLALSGQEVHQTRRIGERVFETWTIPVRDASGQVTDLVGVSTDVTERQQAEQDLARRNEELRRSNTELEQFAYIASHDLQAPIRAVTSFAGVIHQRYSGALDDRGRLYLRQIMQSGEYMKRLVDDLLAFSRVRTEQRSLAPVAAGPVFDAVAGRLQAETPGATITRAALPTVVADAQQLDQLLQNLIANALKYHRPGVAPRVQVSARRDGALWRFAVSDNGIGIEPQYFERIFVIFQRLHSREQYQGTGIGLAVCKKIVERHGGQLWLDSTPGEGTTFFFTLPAG